MEWLWAGIAIVGGFIVGASASKVVRRVLEKRGGNSAQFASAGASLTFSLLLVAGLLVALGFVEPDSLDKLRADTIDYLPRVLSALIVVILGGVAGTIVSTAARESIGRSMGRLGDQIPPALKMIITAFAVILAAAQLGIDTTVVNIAIAGAVGGPALAFALVVAFGSRPVAIEIARGRALRRMVATGDTITSGDLSGKVVAMHPTAIEIDTDGLVTLVPNSEVADSGFAVERPATD